MVKKCFSSYFFSSIIISDYVKLVIYCLFLKTLSLVNSSKKWVCTKFVTWRIFDDFTLNLENRKKSAATLYNYLNGFVT